MRDQQPTDERFITMLPDLLARQRSYNEVICRLGSECSKKCIKLRYICDVRSSDVLYNIRVL